MKYFGKVFVEYLDGDKWNLSMLQWYQYIYGRLFGIIGCHNSNKDFRHVPRNMVKYTK